MSVLRRRRRTATAEPGRAGPALAVWRGLRGRVTVLFAVGALLLSSLLAGSVYALSSSYLTDQRERAAARQAAFDAARVTGRLDTDSSPGEILDDLDLPAGVIVLVRQGADWTATDEPAPQALVPDAVRVAVENGETANARVTLRGQPHIVTGVPLGAGPPGAALYEFAPLLELRDTLRVLAAVLAACAALATIAGAGVGLWAARRVLQPVHRLSATAAEVASGRFDSRLPHTDDPDLAALTTSFNDMVESVHERIERERRFVGDVSHELRTPVTTLTTALEMLERRRDELPERSQRALDLATAEVEHLRRLLDHLLALARAEAGLHQDESERFSVRDLVEHVLTTAGHPPSALFAPHDAHVRGHKLALHRAVRNLVDNADRHGGGLHLVTLDDRDGQVRVVVDDRGPGVPPHLRDHVFERFATAGSARGSDAGTGIGLALVRELAHQHGGAITCDHRPGGGARFVLTLPAAGGTDL